MGEEPTEDGVMSDRFDEIAARVRATTAEPWRLEFDSDGREMGTATTWPYEIVSGDATVVNFTGGHIPTLADAVFFEHAPSDVRWLLAEVASLRAMVKP